MEVILENLSRPGEIQQIKAGEKVKLSIKTRPMQKILVSNGVENSELGQADKTGKFNREITLSPAEIGSWRQDFFLADGSDKGSVCFNVIGENGEVKKDSSGNITEALLNPGTLLVTAAAAYFAYKEFFGDKKRKPKVEPLGDSEEEETPEEDIEVEETEDSEE